MSGRFGHTECPVAHSADEEAVSGSKSSSQTPQQQELDSITTVWHHSWALQAPLLGTFQEIKNLLPPFQSACAPWQPWNSLFTLWMV